MLIINFCFNDGILLWPQKAPPMCSPAKLLLQKYNCAPEFLDVGTVLRRSWAPRQSDYWGLTGFVARCVGLSRRGVVIVQRRT